MSFASQRIKRLLVIKSSGFKRASEPLDLQAFLLPSTFLLFSARKDLAKKWALGSLCLLFIPNELNCCVADQHTIWSKAPESSVSGWRTRLALNNYLPKNACSTHAKWKQKRHAGFLFICFPTDPSSSCGLNRAASDLYSRRTKRKNKHLSGTDYANLISATSG